MWDVDWIEANNKDEDQVLTSSFEIGHSVLQHRGNKNGLLIPHTTTDQDIKRGPFIAEEEKLVIQLHGTLGNRWAAIASQLSGRTNNEIKNLWNTHLKKRLLGMELDPQTHKPFTPCGPTIAAATPISLATR
ncbi:hypothetical protein PTKIN_Ptkin10aG0111000 [Pterospermum kingtungense]